MLQARMAHFSDTLCRQKSLHLVEKEFRGRARRQVVQSPLGPCGDVRCAVVGKFSGHHVRIGLSAQLVDEKPDIPDVAVFQHFPRGQRDRFVGQLYAELKNAK